MQVRPLFRFDEQFVSRGAYHERGYECSAPVLVRSRDVAPQQYVWIGDGDLSEYFKRACCDPPGDFMKLRHDLALVIARVDEEAHDLFRCEVMSQKIAECQ